MLVDNPQQYFSNLGLSPQALLWFQKVYGVLKYVQTGNGSPLGQTAGPGLYLDISGGADVLWVNATTNENDWKPVATQ